MKKQQQYDVIIVGGGLAGLVSAIHLSQQKIAVLLIERNSYPKHKVCGEYVSNEVLPYLNSLGVDPMKEGAKEITEFEITTRTNQIVTARLPLGGFGMSRYSLDYLLSEKAKSSGTEMIQSTVIDIHYGDDKFAVTTKEKKVFIAPFVIGAFGKRSNLDKKLNREFIQKPSDYLGVKTHVKGDFPANKVALHNFKGGYCGVSKVENDHINLCYITDYKSFKKHKSIAEFQEQIVYQNKALREVFSESKPVFEEPLTISQISFDKKPVIENHVFMCGDAAAMIHPLCGNGMGMAISSAQILSTLLVDFFQGEILSRKQLEKMYLTQWNKRFSKRLFIGQQMAKIFKSDRATRLMWRLVQIFPSLVPLIIKNTHGKQ